ncbi:hypothetical protein V8G54_030295 [Vigna mungo]|uniref:APS kinase domain-containing protein n=1 Tax=Vigna mungo TaxID=3915 RepID=A0AAQ3MWS9_VIGMU
MVLLEKDGSLVMEIPYTDAPSMVEECGWRFCLQEDYETSEDKNQVKENSTSFFFTFLVLSSQFPKSRLFSLLTADYAGVICITSLISPYQKDRDACRALIPKGDFIEVFIDVPLQVCEARDRKGLYKLARAGKIKALTRVPRVVTTVAGAVAELDMNNTGKSGLDV